MTKETAASLILGVVSPLPLFTSSVSPSRRPFGPEVKEWGKRWGVTDRESRP